MTFVELAARSAFSLLGGASTPETLAERASAVGMPALALADRFDLGGAIRFTRACRRLGVRPLFGGELRCLFARPTAAATDPPSPTPDLAVDLVLLCTGGAGWRHLSSLITEARLSNPRGDPVLPLGTLEGRTEGLLCLLRPAAIRPVVGRRRFRKTDAGSESALALGAPPDPGAPLAAHEGATGRLLCRLRALFPDRLWLALEHHGLPEEARRAGRWLALAEARGLPWVPTNAPRYARPRDRIVHDVLTCLRYGTTLAEAGDRLLPNGEWYLKSEAQMRARWCFRRAVAASGERGESASASPGLHARRPSGPSDACDCPGCRALARTGEVATLCRFDPADLRPPLPAFPVPGGRGSHDFLRGLVEEGARERYGERFGTEHRRQIEHELEVIGRLGLADYFLITWDVIRFANRRGILVQGRGSAANSAVCYCLGVTAVDPIGLDLLFERFLSEERDEAPDIDLDIAHEDREEVLQYVYRTYGRDHAAMVCETITYRGRMAVRDAARVLGFPTETADALSVEADLGEAIDAARRLADGGAARCGLDPAEPRVRALIRAVAGLNELPRHRSIHVGGFVLSARPIGEVVPVEEASMPDRTVIQWDKDDLTLPGIPKFDLLGLGMLTVLGETIAHVRRTRGVTLDLASIPPDDPAVYDMICEADTVGLFQIESRAQMNTLPRVKPRCFYDLVIEVALIRPGPIQGEMVHPYLRRRRGEEPVTYLDPRLEPILERTLGVPLFQEQGMKVAVTLAGYTPAQADRLRRAMGFKRSARAMEAVGRELAEGLARNGVEPAAAAQIFKQLTAFANYGFPESHAASFALLVYASAYFKHHFAPEYYCAMLNAQPMGFYSPSTLVHDARRHGVEVRPVDLARSAWDSTLESRLEGTRGEMATDGGPDAPALRLGLRLVRGLGPKAREKLRAALEDGRFVSVEDVVRRSGLAEAELRTLAEAGAFETLWPGRREALWELLRRLRGDAGPLAPRVPEAGPPGPRRIRRPDQVTAAPDRVAAGPESRPRRFRPLSRAERVLADYRILGLSPEGHPMEFLREELEGAGVLRATELAGCRGGEEVRVAGIPICRQRPSTAKGVMFVTLEDETGFANFVVLHDVQERYHAPLIRSPVLLMGGVVEREEEVVNVLARTVEPLSPRAGADAVPSRDFR